MLKQRRPVAILTRCIASHSPQATHHKQYSHPFITQCRNQCTLLPYRYFCYSWACRRKDNTVQIQSPTQQFVLVLVINYIDVQSHLHVSVPYKINKSDRCPLFNSFQIICTVDLTNNPITVR